MNQLDAEDLKGSLARDSFARLLGIEILEVRPGYAKASMIVREDMLNFLGLPHGGAIFSLADAAFAAASNSHGIRAVALNVNISYLAPAPVDARLYAEAQEERLGKRTAFYTIRVTNEGGKPLALCQGLVYRLPDSAI